MIRRTTLTLILALALIAALVGCGGAGDSESPELGLRPGTSGGGAIEASGSVQASDTTNPKTADTTGDSSAGGQQRTGTDSNGGVSGGTSGGSTSGGVSTGGTSGGSSGSSTATKMIRIMWWNDTQANPVKSPSIVFAGKSSTPKAGKSAVLSVGPASVGKKLQLIVYPDGPSGQKMVATFVVTPEMVSNSDQDAIHVEVRDSRVRVLGNPIPNFDQVFERRQ